MRRLAWTGFLLAAALGARAETAVYLEGPKDAKKEDLAKCAVAMEKRCKAHGFGAVTAEVVERDGAPQVRVFFASGFDESVPGVVRMLAKVSGAKAEFRVRKPLTDAEREQFKPGPWAEPDKDAAPKGSRWWRMKNREFDDEVTEAEGVKHGPVLLLLDAPSLVVADLGPVVSQTVPDGEQRLYKPAAATVKKLQAAFGKPARPEANNHLVYLALVVDGKATPYTLTAQVWKVVPGPKPDMVPNDKVEVIVDEEWVKRIEPILRNPMPLPLTPVEEKK